MGLSYLNCSKCVRPCLILPYLANVHTTSHLPSKTDFKILRILKKKNVLNSCTQRYLCLSCSRILLLVSDNADEKTSSTVFNPAWAWRGAVVAILLLSTALVVIRKFKHNRRNSTHEDDHAANTEVVTGYTRF